MTILWKVNLLCQLRSKVKLFSFQGSRQYRGELSTL